MFDCYFGGELASSLPRANLFATGAAVDPAAALEFDQVAAVTQYNFVFLDPVQYVFSFFHEQSVFFEFAVSRIPRPPLLQYRRRYSTSQRRSVPGGCYRQKCVRCNLAPQCVHTVLSGLLARVIALPFAPVNGRPSCIRQ